MIVPARPPQRIPLYDDEKGRIAGVPVDGRLSRKKRKKTKPRLTLCEFLKGVPYKPIVTNVDDDGNTCTTSVGIADGSCNDRNASILSNCEKSTKSGKDALGSESGRIGNFTAVDGTRCGMKELEAIVAGGSIPGRLKRRLETLLQDERIIRDHSAQEAVVLSELAMNESRWAGARVATLAEIEEKIDCRFVIETNKVGKHKIGRLECCLAPWEIISAGYLAHRYHWRSVSLRKGLDSTDKATGTFVSGSDTEFLDCADVCHVLREDSDIVKNAGIGLESEHFLPLLLMIMKHGVVDPNRSKSQARISIGNAGQNRNDDKSPGTLFGVKSLREKLEADNDVDSAVDMLEAIGNLTQFIFDCMEGIQKKIKKPRLAPNDNRAKAYSNKLGCALGLDEDEDFRVECITLVASCLYPSLDTCREHKDSQNGLYYQYSKTGTMDVVIRDSFGHLYLLQVIANWRRAVEEETMPYRSGFESVAHQSKLYFDLLNESYAEIQKGHKGDPGTYSTPATSNDLSSFRMDDDLPYKEVNLSPKATKKDERIIEYAVCPKIGLDRLFSYSSAVHGITKCVESKAVELKRDQVIELMFVCSLLNTPARYFHVMKKMLERTEDSSNPFQIGDHPFYDYITIAKELFRSWQGGPHVRFSPYGMKEIHRLFGKDSSDVDGVKRLKSCVAILSNSLLWVDSLQGLDTARDLSITYLEDAFEKICGIMKGAMSGVEKYQYGSFRLSVFFTIAMGCGAVKPGRHLCQLAFPITGTAACKHLERPEGIELADLDEEDQNALIKLTSTVGSLEEEFIAKTRATAMPRDWFDSFMEILSAKFCTQLGSPFYCRMLVECLLCESMHSRCLELTEFHPKGGDTFALFIRWKGKYMAGFPMRKRYGCDDWEPVKGLTMEYAYLRPNDLARWRVERCGRTEYLDRQSD